MEKNIEPISEKKDMHTGDVASPSLMEKNIEPLEYQGPNYGCRKY